MTREEFVAQLDEGEIEILREISGADGSFVFPHDLDANVLELMPLYIHHGLVTTKEVAAGEDLEGWVYLVLTDAGRAAITRYKERAS